MCIGHLDDVFFTRQNGLLLGQLQVQQEQGGKQHVDVAAAAVVVGDGQPDGGDVHDLCRRRRHQKLSQLVSHSLVQCQKESARRQQRDAPWRRIPLSQLLIRRLLGLRVRSDRNDQFVLQFFGRGAGRTLRSGSFYPKNLLFHAIAAD